MEANNQVNKYVVKKAPDLTNVTILSTPLPQATSTVDRRSQQGKSRRSTLDDPNSKHRQLNFDYSNANERSADESSLGIIQNLSSLLEDDTLEGLRSKNCPQKERELAREALQRCSDASLNLPNKENNINSTNLQRNSMQSRPSNVRYSQPLQNRLSNVRESQSLQNRLPNIRESQYSLTNQSEKHTNVLGKKSITTESSITFEPNEMSARSSEFNKTPEKTEPFPPTNLSGFSYNSNVADMMAQFGDEEFVSGSKAGSQILADEMSWRKDQFSVGPVNSNNNEKDRLDLSCFSGIIGDVDLTVDSGRVSVGNYFQRKCGGTGHLSMGTTSDTPSFGLNAQSPQKKGKLRPLVDKTVDLTETSFLPEEKVSNSIDGTIDPSVMSYGCLAQALKEITFQDSVTPGKMVDKFVAMTKKKKQQVENNNLAANTYTVLPNNNRVSLPASATYFTDKPERDLGISSLGSKFSLGSHNINDLSEYQMSRSTNNTTNQESFTDARMQQLLAMKLDDITLNSTKPAENKSDRSLSLQQSVQKSNIQSPNSSVPRAEKTLTPRLRQLSHLPEKPNKLSTSTSINNKSSLIHDTVPSNLSDPTLSKNDSTMRDDNITDSSLKNYSFDTRKVQVGQNTQELCTCLVGIPKEADFELYNGSDRWIICNLILHQIQGEKENIQLTLPNEEILIEPDARRSFKIGVKMPRLSKLTFAEFNIPCIDMVTRTNWNMKHLMCFVPEEPDIRISIPFEDITMNFQTITEDTSSSLPITFENKNSIDIPIIVEICQNKWQLFSIGDCLDDTLSATSQQKESLQVTLKPKQPFSMNIDFKGMSLQSFAEKALQNGLFNAEASLKISICFRENGEHLIKEIPLKGAIGFCKLDIIDTQFPLMLPPRLDKMISLRNSGSIALSATADIVQSKENQTECRDFFICPNNIVLNAGERLTLQISFKPENNKTDIEKHAMLRLVEGNKVSFYPVVGEKSQENEQFNSDSFHHMQIQRCETPQRLRDVTSPTSPHSLAFNRSGQSGRYSPGSTASGGGSIPGVPIPIKASVTSLVWGSVKVGKSDVKRINVRNTSNNKLKLIVSISSDSNTFKILKERQSTTTVATLTLQGMENRSIVVVFSPNLPKAVTGKLSFSYCNSAKVSREPSGAMKMIPLFGHGGCVKMEISEAVKDTSGQMWLSLGKINSDGIQQGKLRLQNFGDLTSFAKIKLVPKALHPSVTSWHVEPTELLLTPNSVQWVSVQFRPRKEDLATAYQTGVIHVGTLKVTYGDEPTRLRIRRLYKKLKDSDQLQDNMNEQSDEFREVIDPLSKAFPGEVFPQDLRQINDSVQSLGDLCKGIVRNEVKLTVEVSVDETISMLNDHMDESQSFYSLCSDRDESYFGGDSFLPTE